MFDTIHNVKIQPKNSNTTAQSSDIMFLARFKINFQNSGSFPEASDILITCKIASMARYCCRMWTSTYSSLRNPTTCSPFFAISKWIENNVFYGGNRTKKKQTNKEPVHLRKQWFRYTTYSYTVQSYVQTKWKHWRETKSDEYFSSSRVAKKRTEGTREIRWQRGRGLFSPYCTQEIITTFDLFPAASL